LLIKIGIPASSMMYFTSELLYGFAREEFGADSYDTVLENSRRKAATYLNIRSEILDESFEKIMKE